MTEGTRYTRRLRVLAAALLQAAAMAMPAAAQTADANLCSTRGVAFGFFNGVQTTPDGADVALAELRLIHGTETADGEPIRYEKFYNYTDGFEDFVETFDQRLQEQSDVLGDRFELFWDALQGGGGSWWQNLLNVADGLGGLLDAFVQGMQASLIDVLAGWAANPPTQVNSLEHRARLEALALEGRKMILVAHSQGNLFVNPAYDFVTTRVPADAVKVVHVAPASPTLRGEHTLADKDLVINGLRALGSVPGNTDVIPGYLNRPAGTNGRTDILGHGLIEIYLNPGLAISQRVKQQIDSALSALVAPPVTSTTGYFTVLLTWDGAGDVDLHTFEPGGLHVYYGNRQGASGYLDVDNTVGFGPEHYYATCDAQQLQTGTYRVSVANFSRASGRTATVQVASWQDGVLGTRQVVLGSPTGSSPGYDLFSVVVEQDDNGQLRVRLDGAD